MPNNVYRVLLIRIYSQNFVLQILYLQSGKFCLVVKIQIIINRKRMSSFKKILYRVTCEIHKLKINKNIDFQTKVMWKRHQKKAQTQSARHAHGFSVFNEPLVLEFEMPYNPDTGLYESKNTQLVAVIVYQGKVKSGGYAKHNISESLNTNPYQTTRLTIPMSQCPDPASYIEVSFSYEKLGEQMDGDEISVLNVSSRDLNMSRIDFKDDKLSFEMDKINELIGKFQGLVGTVRKKGKESGRKVPQLTTKLECLEGQKYALLTTIEKLEKQMKEKDQLLQSQRKKARQQTEDLQKQLQKKNKDLREAKITSDKAQSSKSKENKPDYKQLYENAMKQLDQIRNTQGGKLRKSLDLRLAGNLDDVEKIADFSGNKSSSEEEEDNQKFQQIQRNNTELQSQVAEMSHKLAQLFNASYQYGGAKLLDYLQTSIGLKQY